MTQSRLNQWIALLAVTGVMSYLAWQVLAPFAGVILLGTVLALVFDPAQRFIRRLIRHRAASAALATLLTLLAVVLPFSLAGAALAMEAGAAVGAIQNWISSLKGGWPPVISSAPWLGRLLGALPLDTWLAPENWAALSDSASDVAIKGAMSAFTNMAGMLANTLFLIFVLFFLFRDGEMLGRRLIWFLPMPEEQGRALLARIREVLDASVYGVLLVASVQGLCGGLLFWALGMPSPLLWGVVMMILCTLPVIGAWLVWAPAAAWLAIDGHYGKAALMAGAGWLVVSSVDGLIRPMLVGRRAKLHEVVIFFSVLGGLRYFGPLGLLIGPVVIAVAASLLGTLWEHPQGAAPEVANASKESGRALGPDG